jgi:hypothetical protein
MGNGIMYKIDGVEYKRAGYYGCQLSSRENYVKTGTTRVINDYLMYAWAVEKHLFKPNVIKWSLIDADKPTIEKFISDLGRI